MNVLVTGGTGFVGSHVVRALAKRGNTITVYDNFSTSTGDSLNLDDLKESVKLVSGDILDVKHLSATVEADEIEKVVHAAAAVAQTSRSAMVRTNIEGTVCVLEAMRVNNVRRCVFTSSEETYGSFQYEPADEDHPLVPNVSLYGITKVAGEQLFHLYNRLFNMSCISLRISWAYGPGYPRKRILETFILDGLMGKATTLESGGAHKLDLTYIDDCVEGILLALDSAHPKYSVYNIASGKSHTVKDVADLVKKILPEATMEIGPGLLPYMSYIGAPGHKLPQKGALDISRARDDLGFCPEIDLETGLRNYVSSMMNKRP